MRDLVAGDKLDQYELKELLARSGMASIWKAVDGESGQLVALKVPHMQFESDVVFFERFKREEEIGQRLEHPNIIKMLRPTKKSRMYVAMELVEGRSLRDELAAQKGPMPRDRALAIAQQLCEALVYLHGQGVIHRDLKPENIILTPSGNLKIIDFGIALDKASRRLTWAGLSTTVGTPDYIAPEQIGGRRGDARTDVYAVGTMLYEMLTGHLPHEAPSTFALLGAKTREEPRPPAYYVPDFDPSLEAILLRAIERSPRDRYPDAAALLADLRNPQAVPPRDPATGARRRRRGLSRRLVMPIVIVAILAGLASLVWLSSRRVEPPHAQPPPRRR